LVVKRHYTFGFGLDTQIFGFDRLSLKFVIARIHFGNKFTLTDKSSVIDINTLQGSGYLECEVNFSGSLYSGGKFENITGIRCFYGIDAHERYLFRMLPLPAPDQKQRCRSHCYH